jgi:hypothetical protein
MTNPQYIIDSETTLRERMLIVYDMVKRGLPGGPVVVTLGRKKRTLDQNAKLWSMLRDVSSQVDWHGEELTEEDWKHIFTAALKKQRAVPGIDGGFVVLGVSTKNMEKEEFSALIELIYAFGADRDVQWSEPALECYREYLTEES